MYQGNGVTTEFPLPPGADGHTVGLVPPGGDEEDFRRATWLALEAFSLSGVAPIPVTGMRRMVQSMELAEEDGMAAALNMVGIRRRE